MSTTERTRQRLKQERQARVDECAWLAAVDSRSLYSARRDGVQTKVDNAAFLVARAVLLQQQPEFMKKVDEPNANRMEVPKGCYRNVRLIICGCFY